MNSSGFQDGQNVGFDLYIMLYPMAEPYYVTIGGIPEETPTYVRLYTAETENYIDIREEIIDEFIQKDEIKSESVHPIQYKDIKFSQNGRHKKRPHHKVLHGINFNAAQNNNAFCRFHP